MERAITNGWSWRVMRASSAQHAGRASIRCLQPGQSACGDDPGCMQAAPMARANANGWCWRIMRASSVHHEPRASIRRSWPGPRPSSAHGLGGLGQKVVMPAAKTGTTLHACCLVIACWHHGYGHLHRHLLHPQSPPTTSHPHPHNPHYPHQPHHHHPHPDHPHPHHLQPHHPPAPSPPTP